MMKSIMVVLFTTLAFMSCKKEKQGDPPGPPGFEGKWQGLLGYNNETPSYFYAFQVKPGGSIDRINQAGIITGTGNWSLSGTVFVATYINEGTTMYSVAGTYDSTAHTITGQWGNGYNTSGGGTFHLSKSN